MFKSKLGIFFKKIYDYMFNVSNGIKLQLFNVMLCLLLFFFIITTFVTCLIDFDPMILLTMILAFGSVCFSLWIANQRKNIKSAGIVIGTVFNTMLAPLLFLTTGGRISGMPIWSLLVLVFNWLVVDGIACYLLTFAGIVTMGLCMGIEELGYCEVYRIPTEFGQIVDVLLALTCATLVLGLIFKFQSFVYDKQRKEIIQKDREINKTLTMLESANQELSNANEAKTQFLANMSHEIRTPINAILGMNEMIIRESKEDTIEEYSKNIKQAGDILLSLVNDILDYSKIGSGKMSLIEDNYETVTHVNGITNLILIKAQAKNLSFVLEIDPRMPKVLFGDEIRIRQIITNLLSNAVKYTKEGFVKLKIDLLKLENKQVKYRVSVIDTGIGIKEEEKNKLFELFTRLDEQKNKNIEGTGLGIAISQSLLTLMNSNLNVESVYGEGSTFWFELVQKVIDETPIGEFVEQKVQLKDKQVKNNFIATKANVLFVDDVELNLKVAQGLLKPLGMNITFANSGQEAIDLCEKQDFDIVFMDHMMPGMDGIVATSQIRKISDYYSKAPIIALTANAVMGAKEMFLESGLDDFISKPIDIAQVYKVIEKYLPEEKIEYIDGSDYSVDIDEVPEIDGLDSQKAVNILGSKKVYMQTLKKFYDLIDERIFNIEECEEANDLESYRVNISDLKSFLRTVGADDLADDAMYLEQCCKEMNIFELKNKSPELINNIKELKAKLSLVFDDVKEETEIKKEVINVETIDSIKELLRNKLRELEKCLDSFNLDLAEVILRELEHHDLSLYKAEYDHICQAIKTVDFIEAKTSIITLMAKL